MDVPGGPGPWFCSLLAKENGTRTHFIAHTLPHLALDALNSERSSSVWVMLLKVGPFDQWAESVAFLHQWTTAADRGRRAKLERGLDLYRQHRQRKMLIWAHVTSMPMLTSKRSRAEDEAEEEEVEEALGGDTPPPPAPPTADSIMLSNVTALKEVYRNASCTVGAIKSVHEKFKCAPPKKVKHKK